MKDFNIFFEIPAEIRQHKDTTYTITPIGGPEEYKKHMKELEAKQEARKKAQHEAYLLKRTFYEDIILGQAEASKEALKVPETLVLLQAELSGKPVQARIQVDAKYPELNRKPKRWFDNIWDFFKS